jgi:hypothetical protein
VPGVLRGGWIVDTVAAPKAVAWQLINTGNNIALDMRVWAADRSFVRAIDDAAGRAGTGTCLVGSGGSIFPDRHGRSAQREPK